MPDELVLNFDLGVAEVVLAVGQQVVSLHQLHNNEHSLLFNKAVNKPHNIGVLYFEEDLQFSLH